MEYLEYLDGKRDVVPEVGFDVPVTDGFLFPFQADTVRWACHGGRRAIFADTGLGKTRMQLTWAREVARHTGGRVLVVAPLAVGTQTEREASTCGIGGVRFARHPGDVDAQITVTNYDNIERWESVDLAAVVLDESSILKAFMGQTRNYLIERFAGVPFRLACTATPSPNDYTELGNHSEFLGTSTRAVMLARFFVNDLSEVGTDKWRIKGHAVVPFWDWVASWARMIGVPSDIGPYDDAAYNLPALHIHRHVADVDITDGRDNGMLFRIGSMSATNIHTERRKTAASRSRMVADTVRAESNEPWLIWVDTDYDAAAVREALGDVVEVAGSDSPDTKAARLLGFADGDFRILLTKPKIAGFGMNWQHCARIAFAGVSYSYESFYQAVRRCWRFGQTREVHAHVFMAPTEAHIWATVERKQEGHQAMKAEMFAASRRSAARALQLVDYHPTHQAPLPRWLRSST